MNNVIQLRVIAKKYFLSPLSRDELLRASDIDKNSGFLNTGDGARARFYTCRHKMVTSPNPPPGPLAVHAPEPVPEFRLCA